MTLYKYRAKESPQKVVEGSIEAPGKEAAIKMIEESGLFPVSVEEASSVSQGMRSQAHPQKATTNELVVFSRQLAILIKSGIPILKALDILSQQTQRARFAVIIKEIHSRLKDGAHFSEALSRYPRIFSRFYIALAGAGEDSGKLDEVLLRLSDHFRSREEIASKVKLALIYPAVMACVGAGTVVFMFTFVMPRLMGIFRDLGQSLPLPTKILIAASDICARHGWIALAVMIALVMGVRFELKRAHGRKLWSLLQLRLPLFGPLLLKKEMAILSKTLELLVKSGIPVLKALELTAPVIGNETIRECFLKGYEQLKQGSSLGAALRQFKVFPPFMTNLISIGEESGRLDVPLGELAAAYERDTEESVKAFTAILEPVMILGLGIVVGFIVMAMLLPIFEVNMMIR